MKKTLLFLCAAFLLCFPLPARAAVPEPESISARAAVLMDAESGQTLYEKNAGARRQPASLTKILTAILVLENLEPEQVLTAGPAAVSLPRGSSSAGIRAGERLTVEQLMYAMMLPSANEAANVLAEAVAGSQQDFVEMMNERARLLGALDTNFSNAHGLPARRQRHLTTAHDLALITREALNTPGFMSYFGAPRYEMAATNLSDARNLTHTHRMLLENYSQYDASVTGGKTGYTGPAGYTLATVAQRDGRTLICIVLRSENMYGDTRKLLDFGFDEFEPYHHTFAAAKTPIEVTIRDVERNAGTAYLFGPAEADLLLHESVEPEDISEAFLYDIYPRPGDNISGFAELRLPTGHENGLPGVLKSVPMRARVVMFKPPAAEVAQVAVAAAVAEENIPAPDRAGILLRELDLLWYYFKLQFEQVFVYWAFGIAVGSVISVFGKRRIHALFAALQGKKLGVLGLIPASAIGIASPLCMYGTIPIAASFSEKGMKDDWLAAFMMSSILLNPQLIAYSAALGGGAVAVRVVSCFVCGVFAGLLIKLFYTNRSRSFFNFKGFAGPVNRDTAANPLLRLLKNILRNIKATGPYFLVGIALSAAFQRYVPEDFMVMLFGGDRAFGVLMAATIGVPLYACGGGAVPLLLQWMASGMSMGSAAAFMITGPATKITNLGALKIVLGAGRFVMYLAFCMLFAFLSGILVDTVM